LGVFKNKFGQEKNEDIRSKNTGWNCENYVKKELSDLYRQTDD